MLSQLNRLHREIEELLMDSSGLFTKTHLFENVLNETLVYKSCKKLKICRFLISAYAHGLFLTSYHKGRI